MNAFISFDASDSQLAYELKKHLEENEIKGYLFDQDRQYDSPLGDKIKSAINDSQALVAIITKKSNSPSVHEEIGYALGKEKSLILMLEKDAEDGVLSHEREKEIFTRDCFQHNCKNIVKYLKKIPLNDTRLTTEKSQEFLDKRNILDPTSEHFAENSNSNDLEHRIDNSNIKPCVLFSACPATLLEDIPVHSSQFEVWLEEFRRINVQGTLIRFYTGIRKNEQGRVTFRSSDYYEKYVQYLEFNTNGFVEQGFTHPLVFLPDRAEMFDLNLGWLTVAFHGFLSFIKQYCRHLEYSGSLHIALSIKHTDKLTLMGFGGETEEGGIYLEPRSLKCSTPPPVTDKPNFSQTKVIEVNSLDDKNIDKIARKFADDLSNAYGLDFALCYNSDGTIRI